MIQIGIYKHYKGDYYQVIGIAQHTETLEEVVVYQALYGEYMWVRPLSMFTEVITHNDQEVARFKFIRKATAQSSEKL